MLPASRGIALLGRDVSQLSNDQLRSLMAEIERRFRDEALTSAAEAATIILDGVKADRWRILAGTDAHKIDEMVRQSPERSSRRRDSPDKFGPLLEGGGWCTRCQSQ
jgi:hypothetical protein